MRMLAHWELKLVSLVLAVALYIYTSGQVLVEKTVVVTANEGSIRGLTSEYQVVEITPREFKVQLQLPTSRMGDLEGEALTLRLDLRPDQLAAQKAVWPLTSQLLRVSSDVRIVSTEPADVRQLVVRLDRITEGTLPAEPPHLMGLPPGLDASIRLETTMVRVAAGGDVLELLRRNHDRLRFQDVDLHAIPADLAQERRERLLLTPLPAARETPYRLIDPVAAEIVIRPQLGMAREISAPIQVLAGRDLLRSVELVITPPRAALAVRGPENLLRELKPEAITAFVRIADDATPGQSIDLPVETIAPPWLSVDAPRVRVLLRVTGRP